MALLRRSIAILSTAVVLLSLCSPVFSSGYQRCEEGAKFEPAPGECSMFFACYGSRKYKMPCPSELVFSLSKEQCVFDSEEVQEECRQFTRDDLDIAALTVAPPGGSSSGEMDDRQKATLERMVEESFDRRRGDGGRRGGGGGSRDRNSNDDEDGRDRQQERLGRVETTTQRFLSDDVPRGIAALLPNGAEAERALLCRGAGQKAVHRRLCHRYIDCSVEAKPQPSPFLRPFERECPYPLQFSTDTGECENHWEVDCGDRQEAQDACDYASNQCTGPNCRSCRSQFASCKGKPDGVMYWPGREGTGFWVQCQGGRMVNQGDCGNDDKGRMKVFDTKKGKCVLYKDNLRTVCKRAGGTLPHDSKCHLYFDCAEVKNVEADDEDVKDVEGVVKVCPYPQLFSVSTGKCEDFRTVDCGERKEAVTPCEYEKCEDKNLASCEGFPDGDNVCRTREGSPHYVTCLQERTVERHMCPVDNRGLFMQFAPGARRCLPVDATDSSR